MSMLEQIQEEKLVEEKKLQHKLSQVFLNAPEKQCSGHFYREYDSGEKEYCALGLGLLYYGFKNWH